MLTYALDLHSQTTNPPYKHITVMAGLVAVIAP
jgi:hypothetical protein